MMFYYRGILALAILFCGGCVSTDKYYWGRYETILHDMYVKPGEATPEVQIEKLTTDIQRAYDNGKQVPPGVFAHLGFMYALTGNVEQAQAAFDREKTMFPESEVLIDGLKKRLKKSQVSQRKTNGLNK